MLIGLICLQLLGVVEAILSFVALVYVCCGNDAVIDIHIVQGHILNDDAFFE